MNKIVFVCMVLVVALVTSCNMGNRNSQPSFGPGNFDPEAMVDRMMEETTETLDLSKDQEKQLREIMLENFDKMAKMREEMQNSGGGFENMREQMQEAREEQNKKIKEILSEEQWEKYQVMQEERRARRGQGGPGRPQ